jgi:membrane protease YdiL (CAAX protease family)
LLLAGIGSGTPGGWVTVYFAAIVFGAVHAPDWTLVGLCAVAGLVWTWCYLRHPTLLPLALAHGWSGAFVYTWILDRSALQ